MSVSVKMPPVHDCGLHIDEREVTLWCFCFQWHQVKSAMVPVKADVLESYKVSAVTRNVQGHAQDPRKQTAWWEELGTNPSILFYEWHIIQIIPYNWVLIYTFADCRYIWCSVYLNITISLTFNAAVDQTKTVGQVDCISNSSFCLTSLMEFVCQNNTTCIWLKIFIAI